MESVMELYLTDLTVEKKEEKDDMTSIQPLLEVDQWVHEKRVVSCWNLRDIECLWKVDCSVDKRGKSSSIDNDIIDSYYHDDNVRDEITKNIDNFDDEIKQYITTLWSIDCFCFSSTRVEEKQKQKEDLKELYEMDLAVSKQSQPLSKDTDPFAILYQSDQLFDKNEKATIMDKNKNKDECDNILWSHLYCTDLEMNSRREEKQMLESSVTQGNNDKINESWKALLDIDQEILRNNNRGKQEEEQLMIQTLYNVDCLVEKKVIPKDDEYDHKVSLVDPYVTRYENETHNNYCNSNVRGVFDLSLVISLFQTDTEVDQKKQYQQEKACMHDLYEVDCAIDNLSRIQKINDRENISSLLSVDEWTNQKQQMKNKTTSNSDILEHLWNVDQEVQGLQMYKNNLELASTKSVVMDTDILLDLWKVDCLVDKNLNSQETDEFKLFNPYPVTINRDSGDCKDIRMSMTMSTDDHFLADLYQVDQEISAASFKSKNQTSVASPEILSLLQVDSFVERAPTANGKRSIFSHREKNQAVSNNAANRSNMMMVGSTMVVPATTTNYDISMGQTIYNVPKDTINSDLHTEKVDNKYDTYFPEEKKDSSNTERVKSTKKKNWFDIFSN